MNSPKDETVVEHKRTKMGQNTQTENTKSQVELLPWMRIVSEAETESKIPGINFSVPIVLPLNTKGMKLVDVCVMSDGHLCVIDQTLWDLFQTSLEIFDLFGAESVTIPKIGGWCFVSCYEQYICLGSEGDKVIRVSDVAKVMKSPKHETFTQNEVPVITNVSVSRDVCRNTGIIVYESSPNFVAFDARTGDTQQTTPLPRFWSFISMPKSTGHILAFNMLGSCSAASQSWGGTDLTERQVFAIPESVSFVIPSRSTGDGVEGALMVTDHNKCLYKGETYEFWDIFPASRMDIRLEDGGDDKGATLLMGVQHMADDVYIFFNSVKRRFYVMKIQVE